MMSKDMFCNRMKIPVALPRKSAFSRTEKRGPRETPREIYFCVSFFVLLLPGHGFIGEAFVEGGCFVVDVLYRSSEASSPRK
jgi:hypothetical protein